MTDQIVVLFDQCAYIRQEKLIYDLELNLLEFSNI